MAKPTFTLEMNGQRHILTIGLGFLDKLDALPKYQMNRAGANIGSALQVLFANLAFRNAGAIRDVIKYGTMTNSVRPTDDEIESWIYEQLDDEDLSEKMFADFLEIYKKLPGAKQLLKQSRKSDDKAKPIEKEPSKDNTSKP